MAETTALQAKMKFDTAEVTQARTLKKGYKVTGISGSGTVKLNKVTSYWLKRAAQAIKEGKAIRGTIISNLDDPEEEYVPKEYGIDFKTGQLSGKIVEGVDALMVWCWIALHTPRYRYYIYSDEYGQEFEDLIGKQYSEGYTNSELERMTEECLCVNPYIEGITDFECVKKDEKIMLSFKLITTLGEQEAEIYV